MIMDIIANTLMAHLKCGEVSVLIIQICKLQIIGIIIVVEELMFPSQWNPKPGFQLQQQQPDHVLLGFQFHKMGLVQNYFKHGYILQTNPQVKQLRFFGVALEHGSNYFVPIISISPTKQLLQVRTSPFDAITNVDCHALESFPVVWTRKTELILNSHPYPYVLLCASHTFMQQSSVIVQLCVVPFQLILLTLEKSGRLILLLFN